MKKSIPTPALPLSGEGVEENTDDIAAGTAPLLTPPPEKGEAGWGLSKKTRLHNLKPQINNRQNRKNPTEPEQQKIASVLTTADQEIDTLQQKLSHLKQEKKALMQQLLTGKRRVTI